ncbi:MAG TPA: hypothetical protein PKL15_02940, partial [Saprospiraceae bacterium]|nr:hypothetical protein [Saprospiraceae bacterium]
MKQFLPICLLLLHTVWAGSQNPYPAGFPSFKTVQSRFFSTYSLGENILSADAIKKPEGYYVVLRSRDDFRQQAPMLFWSAKKNAYLPLNLPPGDSYSKF